MLRCVILTCNCLQCSMSGYAKLRYILCCFKLRCIKLSCVMLHYSMLHCILLPVLHSSTFCGVALCHVKSQFVIIYVMPHDRHVRQSCHFVHTPSKLYGIEMSIGWCQFTCQQCLHDAVLIRSPMNPITFGYVIHCFITSSLFAFLLQEEVEPNKFKVSN